ncbi:MULTISPECIES: potassium-transporting ATPase subunit F [Mycobacteriales]|uniref:Potassium-transporting ATPase subunit F n=1 Tax=Gordonia rubripertincta TaxID=36822 RepID=A0ABT4N177_GORRU|nr:MULTISPECIES: potassium-transporting ATPase subunit F [Mycobacteriales]MBA4025846.1 K(+)-transporting ATPase subunit F [Gordonia sp. (in: high G+C Gram-positive bacteria)]MCZ4553013.1 potassium-transporting ATPase subunit F [Gordonia rubripertincta]ORM32471.1 potassium-transporting ATPase subunit F [Williamsia sp. 1135]OZG30735.1 potassium-transporting ATPase subunit F [Williamsia sp. 1138]
MTADGATNVVLLIIAIVVVLYLCAALVLPERF